MNGLEGTGSDSLDRGVRRAVWRNEQLADQAGVGLDIQSVKRLMLVVSVAAPVSIADCQPLKPIAQEPLHFLVQLLL